MADAEATADDGAQALSRLRQTLQARMGARFKGSTSTLARNAGLGRTTVSNALNDGHPPPSWHTVAAIAQTLGFRAEYIEGELHELWSSAASAKATTPRKPDLTALVSNLRARKPEPFVGRETELERLATFPWTGTGLPPITVRGMGGAGKTTLVLHHAWAQRAAGPNPVWWIDATGPDAIETGLAGLAGELDRDIVKTLPVSEAAAWATHWLEERTGWMLVFDNVEDGVHLQPWIARLTTGQVLITTRRTLAWQRGSAFLDLGPVDREHAVALLKELTGHSDEEAVAALTELAVELGDLPLALRQAGAFMAQTAMTPGTYLALLREDLAGMLAEQPPVDDEQEKTIARLWSVTLSTLRHNHPDAVLLLRVLAYCAPSPLPRTVLDGALPSPLRVVRALGVLAAYSLVTLTADEVTVHRLLQAVLRADAGDSLPAPDEAGDASALAVALLDDAAPAESTPDDVTGWPLWDRFLPHVEAVVAHRDGLEPLPELAHLMGRTGTYLHSRGHLTLALDLRRRALTLSQRLHGPRHPDTLTHMNNLAVTLSEAGHYAEAEPMFRETLRLNQEIHGERHLSTAASLCNLGHALTHLGRHNEALAPSETALEITRDTLGEDHPETASRLDNLAAVHTALGHYPQALELGQRALEITQTALGDDHPDTAIRLGNLAAVHTALGHYPQALELERRALEITQTALGDDHPDTALRMSNLATTLRATGRYDEALGYAEDALRITQEAFGPGHLGTAVRLGNLSLLRTAKGEYEQALALDREALDITRDVLGENNPDTALRLSNISQSLRRTGQLPMALEHGRQAMDIATATMEPEHPELPVFANNLATIYDELGRHEDAYRLKTQALRAAEKALGRDHPTCANYASNLVYTLHRLGRYEEALPHARRAVALTTKALGQDHAELAVRLHNLAQTLLSLNQREEGLTLQRQALEIATKALGPAHPTTAHLRARLDAATDDERTP
ncbi:tetratricopeptide repeat protein [Streptomyces bugieae]|uniref:Tetratricopeptide repeat protein n=1 Tax=Streptomyces bugieae TaxID=3098223 RepID=A0ABU7NIQ0_9ACTN|nr:tetratricopeptide repeat protein [Streptomyces sp. DSM 41528]